MAEFVWLDSAREARLCIGKGHCALLALHYIGQDNSDSSWRTIVGMISEVFPCLVRESFMELCARYRSSKCLNGAAYLDRSIQSGISGSKVNDHFIDECFQLPTKKVRLQDIWDISYN